MTAQKSRNSTPGAGKATHAGVSESNYVGRDDAVVQLHHILSERQGQRSKVVIQSIEGPGGIGKTALFEHVLAKLDRTEMQLLTMRVRGDQSEQRDPFQLVQALIASCESPVEMKSPIAQRFSNSEEVRAIYGEITAKAKAELRRAFPELPIDQLMQVLRATVECGKQINDLSQVSKEYLSFDKIEKHLPKIESTLKTLKPLMEEVPGLLEKLGATKTAALRNSIRVNPLNVLAEAFVNDLTALIVGYEKKNLLSPAQSKIEGLKGVLLVLDDYESLSDHMGEFLVSQLIPKLKVCGFPTTLVILGRDQLALTHPGWNQHHQRQLARPISLSPLTRQEMDELVRANGRTAKADLKRAWDDTMGYPLLVMLWLDETREAGQSEGPSIGMLKRFHDRTTHWLSEEQKRWLYHALFLPKVNVETFAAALGSDAEGQRALRWFEGDGSVRDAQGRAFRVRPYVRSRLADYLEATDPPQFRKLQARAAAANA